MSQDEVDMAQPPGELWGSMFKYVTIHFFYIISKSTFSVNILPLGATT
jgi:hypothetical protein